MMDDGLPVLSIYLFVVKTPLEISFFKSEVYPCYDLRPTIPQNGSIIDSSDDHRIFLEERINVTYEPFRLRSDMNISW